MTKEHAEEYAVKRLPFNPAKLDDLGLPPFEFRVFMRICRRAGDHGLSWESVGNIATACLMSRRRVQSALRLLETIGLIVPTEHKRGGTTSYQPTHPARWPNAAQVKHTLERLSAGSITKKRAAAAAAVGRAMDESLNPMLGRRA